MAGLSQLELDMFCVSEEANSEEPSSPIGTVLLARKRQRHEQRPQLSSLACEVDPCLSLEIFADEPCTVDNAEGGLSQAALDEMLVEAQPTEDTVATSPIGEALRSAKNRRRWGAAKAVEVNVAEEASSFKGSFPNLLCPPSWGAAGIGFSQADLDEMCGEEICAATADGDALPGAGYTIQVQPPSSPVPQWASERTVSAKGSPRCLLASQRPDGENMCHKSSLNSNNSLNSRSTASPGKFGSPLPASPGRRRRTSRRADAENMGRQASENSNVNSISPRREKDMSSSGALQMLSPARRTTLSPAACPLSPIRL